MSFRGFGSALGVGGSDVRFSCTARGNDRGLGGGWFPGFGWLGWKYRSRSMIGDYFGIFKLAAFNPMLEVPK